MYLCRRCLWQEDSDYQSEGADDNGDDGDGEESNRGSSEYGESEYNDEVRTLHKYTEKVLGICYSSRHHLQRD
jgi:hypothetical protein